MEQNQVAQTPVEQTPAEQTQEQTPQQPKQKSLKEQVKQQARKFKLKINGSDRQVDEKTLLALAQRGGAADEKFQKSAARQKQVDQLLTMAKKDPDRFIKQVLGQDAVEFSKKRLAKELQELSLDPKEKELRQYKRKVQQYESQKKSQEQAKQKAADEKAVAHWTSHYDKVLPQAIKNAGLPMTEDVIRHATDIMIANLEQGFDLPMEAVMDLTKDRYLSSVKKFLTSADKDKLVDLLGADVVSKLGVKVTKSTVKGKQSLPQGRQSQRTIKSQREQMQDLDERIKRWQSQQ